MIMKDVEDCVKAVENKEEALGVYIWKIECRKRKRLELPMLFFALVGRNLGRCVIFGGGFLFTIFLMCAQGHTLNTKFYKNGLF